MKSRYISYLLLGVVMAAGASQSACAQNRQLPPPPPPATAGTMATVNPTIPNEVMICGQTVSLDPVDYAERYDRELTSLMYTHGNTLLLIKRANRYFPQMAQVLRDNGVPDDILYLACVESTLNPRAVSPAKAAGMWQFLASTAKEYGLEVSDEVDERYNIEKATAAAARYLKNAYREYGDWNSVFASYNAGRARITKQLGAQNADNALDLYLVDETQRYPFRIMATKAIMENPAIYGFRITPDQLYRPREVKIVEVNGPVASWADWAERQGCSYRELRDENPWIRDTKLTNKLGKIYRVRVPLKETRNRSTSSVPVFNPNWVK